MSAQKCLLRSRWLGAEERGISLQLVELPLLVIKKNAGLETFTLANSMWLTSQQPMSWRFHSHIHPSSSHMFFEAKMAIVKTLTSNWVFTNHRMVHGSYVHLYACNLFPSFIYSLLAITDYSSSSIVNSGVGATITRWAHFKLLQASICNTCVF